MVISTDGRTVEDARQGMRDEIDYKNEVQLLIIVLYIYITARATLSCPSAALQGRSEGRFFCGGITADLTACGVTPDLTAPTQILTALPYFEAP